jgi:hypothetical protein
MIGTTGKKGILFSVDLTCFTKEAMLKWPSRCRENLIPRVFMPKIIFNDGLITGFMNIFTAEKINANKKQIEVEIEVE